MSYSIVLFSNFIFNILQILWTPKIFNNFSSCEILIFEMVELFVFIFQIVKFYKIVSYSKLVNYYLENWLILQIINFWHWKFLGGIQIIEWSNVERPGFRNVKITNIKIMKDKLFHFFIYEFIFLLLKMKL